MTSGVLGVAWIPLIIYTTIALAKDNSPSSYLVIPIISYLPFPPCYAPSINKLQPERVFKKCFQVSTMTILSLSDFSLYTGKFCDSQDTPWPTMELKDTPRWGKHVYPFLWLEEFLPPATQCLVPGLHTASLEQSPGQEDFKRLVKISQHPKSARDVLKAEFRDLETTGKMAVYQKQAGMGGKRPRSSKLLQGVHIQTDRCCSCVYLIDTGKGWAPPMESRPPL